MAAEKFSDKLIFENSGSGQRLIYSKLLARAITRPAISFLRLNVVRFYALSGLEFAETRATRGRKFFIQQPLSFSFSFARTLPPMHRCYASNAPRR